MSTGSGLIIAGVALIGVGMVSGAFKYEHKPVAETPPPVSAQAASRSKRVSNTDPVVAAKLVRTEGRN